MDQFFGITLTDEQKDYIHSIYSNQLTIVNAKSGTGKTTLAVAAARILNQKMYYIFSPVSEKKMGFRPGTQTEKEIEYLQPLRDALLEINENPEQAIISAEKTTQSAEAWVEPMSHVFARGINLKDSTVIIDEAQNFTRGELKKLLTRVHDSCKVIMIGHDGQCDLEDEKKSGFTAYMNHFRDRPYAGSCQLTINFRGQLAQDADEMRW